MAMIVRPSRPVRSLTIVLLIMQTSAVALVILLTVIFLAGCESSGRDQIAKENGLLRRQNPDQAIHGEIGTAYGRGGS